MGWEDGLLGGFFIQIKVRRPIGRKINFKLSKKSRSKFKGLKHAAVEDLARNLAMLPLSG
jgi:hypothetical protein